MKRNRSLLVISDLHIPYHHPDSFKFLNALNTKYKPDRIICIGDEVDNHALSFHDTDPNLLSAGDELLLSIEYLKKLSTIFPKMDIIDSNHGSMVFRKTIHHGIPLKLIKSIGDILEAPDTWKWHNYLIVNCADKKVLFQHQIKKNIHTEIGSRGMNIVQGHYHESLDIKYVNNSQQLLWSMSVGCLLDDNSMAFQYNKINPNRPVLGTGVIIEGWPRIIPMVLNKNGNWIGKIL